MKWNTMSHFLDHLWAALLEAIETWIKQHKHKVATKLNSRVKAVKKKHNPKP